MVPLCFLKQCQFVWNNYLVLNGQSGGSAMYCSPWSLLVKADASNIRWSFSTGWQLEFLPASSVCPKEPECLGRCSLYAKGIGIRVVTVAESIQGHGGSVQLPADRLVRSSWQPHTSLIFVQVNPNTIRGTTCIPSSTQQLELHVSVHSSIYCTKVLLKECKVPGAFMGRGMSEAPLWRAQPWCVQLLSWCPVSLSLSSLVLEGITATR